MQLQEADQGTEKGVQGGTGEGEVLQVITAKQLRQIMHYLSDVTARTYTEPINDAMIAFGIDETGARQAAFLAQIAHESGELRYACEIASGSDYEGRKDLGNCQAGDGRRFKGRGLLQITGRSNYDACSLALYGDDRLLSEPELLEQPDDGAQAAGWFWQVHGLNPLADAGKFERISRIINRGGSPGPINGAEQRVIYWERAKQVLGVAA